MTTEEPAVQSVYNGEKKTQKKTDYQAEECQAEDKRGKNT